jgi:hypothetical protein
MSKLQDPKGLPLRLRGLQTDLFFSELSQFPPATPPRELENDHDDEDENDWMKFLLLYPSHQNKDQDNNEYETEAAGWVVAPTRAIGPGWQCAD